MWCVTSSTGSPAFSKPARAPTLPAGPSPDDDPVAAWTTFKDGVQAMLDDPASQDRTFTNPHTGSLSLPLAISRFFTADLFMHTWDLARATCQNETLGPERCASMLEGMEPMEDLPRGSGQYGPRVEVPEKADPQTQLIAFIGRDPRLANGHGSAERKAWTCTTQQH